MLIKFKSRIKFPFLRTIILYVVTNNASSGDVASILASTNFRRLQFQGCQYSLRSNVGKVTRIWLDFCDHRSTSQYNTNTGGNVLGVRVLRHNRFQDENTCESTWSLLKPVEGDVSGRDRLINTGENNVLTGENFFSGVQPSQNVFRPENGCAATPDRKKLSCLCCVETCCGGLV